MTEFNLGAIRAQIDELDVRLQDLFTQRARLALQVAAAKNAEENNPVFYRPEREAEVLRMALARNQGPLPDEAVTHFFREVMSACLALQKPLHIAFLGPEGTYSQAAALKHFGSSARGLPMQTIEEVFRTVEAGEAQYGVVPVENSTEGAVNQSLDLFVNSPVKICGEVELGIHHHLLSKAKELGAIRRIYSHQQSLAQCRTWLGTHLPHIECIALRSNAEAARQAARESNAAAIAGKTAAELYDLTILASRIEDVLDNTTRFAIIGLQDVPPTGKDKTSLLFSPQHSERAGVLYEVLEPLREHGISMTRIESRPSRRGVWHYAFFIDLEGHADDPALQTALRAMQAHCTLFKPLGSYPRAIL